MSALPDHAPPSRSDMIDEKAWEHLGITGQEFRRAWYSGQYRNDPRPEVAALDHYMRTGRWEVPGD